LEKIALFGGFFDAKVYKIYFLFFEVGNLSYAQANLILEE